MQLREAADDDILGVVSILILIDQDILKQLLILGQHVGAVAQQDVGLQQQIVEVHSSVLLAAAAVLGVDVTKVWHLHMTILGSIDRVSDIGTRRYEAVFGVRNAREHLRRLVLVVGEVFLLADGLNEVLAVRGFVDGVRLRVAYALGILAQDTRKDRVESTHTNVARHGAHHLLDARTHLLGRLVGKGQSQNIIGLHALLQHICYARSEHTRFTRARTRNDERGGLVVDNGIVLRLI